jgi:hypothetical protein
VCHLQLTTGSASDERGLYWVYVVASIIREAVPLVQRHLIGKDYQ